jgi:hypothetical protein
MGSGLHVTAADTSEHEAPPTRGTACVSAGQYMALVWPVQIQSQAMATIVQIMKACAGRE